MSKTDKATARPWLTIENAISNVKTFMPREQYERKAETLEILTHVQSEHAALEAVAEAANRILVENKKTYPHRSPEWAYDYRGISEKQAAMNDFLKALDNLAAVKGKEQA